MFSALSASDCSHQIRSEIGGTFSRIPQPDWTPPHHAHTSVRKRTFWKQTWHQPPCICAPLQIVFFCPFGSECLAFIAPGTPGPNHPLHCWFGAHGEVGMVKHGLMCAHEVTNKFQPNFSKHQTEIHEAAQCFFYRLILVVSFMLIRTLTYFHSFPDFIPSYITSKALDVLNSVK